MSDYWEQFEVEEYSTPQYKEVNDIHFNYVPVLAILVVLLLLFMGVKYKMFFNTKIQKFFIILGIIGGIILSYQLFFRYEYKVQNDGRKIIKIDKLTGKSTYTVPERETK